MKANELRYGNYISCFGTVHRLWYLDGESIGICNDEEPATCEIDDAEPIPLTEEWLLKFGFVEGNFDDDNKWMHLRYRYFVFASDESVKFERVFIRLNKMDVVCEHVHQLQNLYYALTGQELEITEQ